MSAIKKYFKEQCQVRMCGLEHANPSEFYLSVWQTNRSATPLFVLRLILFLGSLAIVLASSILYIQSGIYGFWFIYLTHWGLTANVAATGFAALVSARSFFYGPTRTKHQLPWYVMTYWILYNIAAPVAFLITLFYWTVLFEAGVEEELNYGLDVAVHGLNSVVMFVLVVTSAQPTRLLHMYHPLGFSLVFFLFTLFYYLAGGVDVKQNPFVYSVLDWRHAGTTVGVGVLTGFLLVFLYLVTMLLSLGRDAIAKKFVKPSVYVNEELPLRQPTAEQTQTGV
ncbi:protein rolling stone-like [Plodia interpunctella]|uniref:protein rolling stone-like n=1 Tax=Plodia interpunctella TaxID=58824 RepID=UPI002367F605|nr:protein rolling stone-like [Plodia interpunctella]